ncbi:MAG: adenylate/guanylate cyclase domain-containing protein [Treponema sp.]|nr:MAG: adenylate/guanylate cyclase domain-containing protein [Treponema sp.]
MKKTLKTSIKGQINQIITRVIFSPYYFKIISILLIGLFMALPFSMNAMDLFNPQSVSEHFYPLTVLFSDNIQIGFDFFSIICILLFVLPLFLVTIFISIFVKKINNKAVSWLLLTATTIYLLACMLGMIKFANTNRWFQSLNNLSYVGFSVALITHIILISYKMTYIKLENQYYAEYKNILIQEEKKQKKLRKAKIKKFKKKFENNNDTFEKRLNNQKLVKEYIKKIEEDKIKFYLKKKIILIFISTILVVLGTFVYTDLNNYHKIFTEAVNTTGKNKAEQVAEVFYFSDGLHSKINSFLQGIKRTNQSSPFPLKRADIITTSNRNYILLDELNSSTKFPEFDVFSYTTCADKIKQIPEDEKRITAKDAAFYIEHFFNKETSNKPIYKPEKGTCLYIHPITFAKKNGNKLVGFSVITYYQEIIDRPYYQAKVFLFAVSALFLYCSIIIILLLADLIANPIIFLCGSIRKTANTLSEMLSGNAEIEASQLIFDDHISTNDEIKSLSIEIGHIVSLIRGVLPYVSFHTLRNAEKHVKHKIIKRDVCFLFTDIRGFTTLCENIPPEEIIPILNHYLDLETKIIFDNGGDIDKYVGDEMMAFFAGPRKEIRACKAALEIQKAIQLEKIAAIKEGTSPISIGIGINSGPVVFGSVGAETRKDFTSIGDTVNLAARLEGTNKAYGSKSIISESVYEKLNDRFLCRELDYVAVKGKTEPVRIYEIIEAKALCTDKQRNLKKIFETGLAHYRKKNWKTAEKYFYECKERYNDAPSKIFLKRILHYQITPPASNWKGVFVMNVK